MLKKIYLFYFFTIFNLSCLVLIMLICWWYSPQPTHTYYQQRQRLASQLLLTDYCLSTESRHTRNPSQTEWIAPFQDLPAYHEHFPSSSFFIPKKD